MQVQNCGTPIMCIQGPATTMQFLMVMMFGTYHDNSIVGKTKHQRQLVGHLTPTLRLLL